MHADIGIDMCALAYTCISSDTRAALLQALCKLTCTQASVKQSPMVF